jgi:hypothetical protein
MQLAECTCAAVAMDDLASSPLTLKECLVIGNASSKHNIGGSLLR